MYTVCPKCALTLVVTAADLRVAQGYVRCGRCLNVFNALARLSEDRPSATPSTPETTPQSTQQTTPFTRPDITPDRTPEQDISEPATQSSLDETGEIEIELDASLFLEPTQTQAPPEETAEREALVEAEPAPAPGAGETAAPEELSAHEAQTAPPEPSQPAPPEPSQPEPSQPAPPEPTLPEPPRPEPPQPEETAAEALPSVPAETDGTADSDGAAAGTLENPAAPGGASSSDAVEPPATVEAAAEAAEQDTVSPESAEAQHSSPAPEQSESPFEPQGRRSRSALAWNIAASALALALALQIVNHYRDALAANPALERPLGAVYAAFGVRLTPHWNVHAYDVRQLGASVGGAAAGEIVVRASVKNSARRAQPMPLLRVTLQDRFGNRIAARDVPPSDYLPSSAAASALLAAGGRVDATMAFVDPGPQAVGFEIDACLRQRSGTVACAHGP